MRVRPMLLRRPSFLFDCFVKIWEKGQKFFGQMVYRPPWQKIARTPMSASRERHICLFFVLFFKVHSGINSQAAAPGC